MVSRHQEGWAVVACPSPMQEERAAMAEKEKKQSRQTGVTPYSTAKRLVDNKLMSPDALERGITEGSIAAKPLTRDYGEDQEFYEALQKYADDINTRTAVVNFSITSRKKAVDEGETG